MSREVTVVGESDNAAGSARPGALESASGFSGASQAHSGSHDHAHIHIHQMPGEGAIGEDRRQLIELNRSVLAKNDRLAERNRGFFRAKRLLVLNVLSSPGSGKTTLIQKTAETTSDRCRVGVIVGDLATENDAMRLHAARIPVVQINTGTVCHLDAEMVSRACGQLDLDAIDLLIIENVGNLVCPAGYDLGEDLRVVLLSVTEGEDKPLKYPPAFHSASVAIVTKCDLAAAVGWDRAAAFSNLSRSSHHARVFELSAKTGQGMGAWLDFLWERVRASKQ